MAQFVGALSRTPEGFRFDPWSGHVQEAIDRSFSCTLMSVCLSVCLSLSLSPSAKSIKTYLKVRRKTLKNLCSPPWPWHLPRKDFSDAADGDNNENDFTVLHKWMCQRFEDLYNSVSQYFPNDQWLYQNHVWGGNQLKYEIYRWILILFIFV